MYLQPIPSMSLDVAANSAVNGDITPEVKNAGMGVGYLTKLCLRWGTKNLLSTANATVNSERGPRMMTITHQGKARKSERKVTHSGPLRSASHPVRGDASVTKIVSWRRKEI